MPDSSPNNSQGRWCHSSISERNCLALPSRYAEYDTLSRFAKKEVMDHWPEPDPPLLLVLEPASDAPVAAVPADPAPLLLLPEGGGGGGGDPMLVPDPEPDPVVPAAPDASLGLDKEVEDDGAGAGAGAPDEDV